MNGELLRQFRELAKARIFIRTIYAPNINEASRVKTTHRLITATQQGKLYIARADFLHELHQILSCKEGSLAEPPHEIREDEMLWDFISRHSGYSDINSEDPLLAQMNVYSVSRARKRDRTNLNFLVDLMEARSFLIEHADAISRIESNNPQAIISRLFAERLEGFLEEKLRQLNAAFRCLTDT